MRRKRPPGPGRAAFRRRGRRSRLRRHKPGSRRLQPRPRACGSGGGLIAGAGLRRIKLQALGEHWRCNGRVRGQPDHRRALAKHEVNLALPGQEVHVPAGHLETVDPPKGRILLGNPSPHLVQQPLRFLPAPRAAHVYHGGGALAVVGDPGVANAELGITVEALERAHRPGTREPVVEPESRQRGRDARRPRTFGTARDERQDRESGCHRDANERKPAE